MKDNIRAAIAYIAGRTISGRNSSAIFDFNVGRYRMMSGTVNAPNTSIFDYQEGAYVTGTFSSLYHYGEGVFIQMNINRRQFNGFDFGSGNFFAGNVNGNSISMFDHGTGRYHSYSL